MSLNNKVYIGISFAAFVMVHFIELIIELVVRAVREVTGLRKLRLEDVEERVLKNAMAVR
ncbi:MAG: hypothetical protein ACE5PM_00360 [Candidatus Hydrothermarchaeales archaeon]